MLALLRTVGMAVFVLGLVGSVAWLCGYALAALAVRLLEWLGR